MDRRHITLLAVRLFGVYAALSAFVFLGHAVSEVQRMLASAPDEYGSQFPTSFYSVFGLVGWALVAIVFLGFGRAVAARWCPEALDAPRTTSSVSTSTFETTGYRLIGVYALVTYAPMLFLAAASAVEAGVAAWDSIWWEDLLAHAFGAALGLGLLFGARGLAGLVERARGAGLQPDEQPWRNPRQD